MLRMSDYNMPILQMDPEFEFLIQERTTDYIEHLEEDIFDKGCTFPLYVWGDIILDGRLRYKICREWSVPFSVRNCSVTSRAEAVSLICTIQLKRDDLTQEYRRYLIGRLFLAKMEIVSAEHLKEHPEHSVNEYGRLSQKYVKKSKVASEIGKVYNFGYSTVVKYSIYAECLDTIREKSARIVNKILAGEIRVSHENAIELSRLPIEDIHGLERLLAEGTINRIGYSQLRHELRWQRLPTGIADSRRIKRENASRNAGIRKVPTHDPDSELSSLGFTIPSWTDTITRATERTDFSKISDKIRNDTKRQLKILMKKTQLLLTQLEEDDYIGR